MPTPGVSAVSFIELDPDPNGVEAMLTWVDQELLESGAQLWDGGGFDSGEIIEPEVSDQKNKSIEFVYSQHRPSFISETIDSGGKVGQCCSMAIDSQDNVHICYLDRTNNDLEYATNSSGDWALSTVDKDGGWYCSIGIDSNDRIHISYHANGGLRYAARN